MDTSGFSSIINLWAEICSIIESVEAERCRTKKSKKKTMKGKMLYSSEAMNENYKEAFKKKGWGEDFVKERVALEVRLGLGKYAFTVYDLFFKHLAFFAGV